jgi:high-affinity nickel-transport protein
LLAGQLHWDGEFWQAITRLNDNFGALGFLIICLFVACWLISIAVYKWGDCDNI